MDGDCKNLQVNSTYKIPLYGLYIFLFSIELWCIPNWNWSKYMYWSFHRFSHPWTALVKYLYLLLLIQLWTYPKIHAEPIDTRPLIFFRHQCIPSNEKRFGLHVPPLWHICAYDRNRRWKHFSLLCIHPIHGIVLVWCIIPHYTCIPFHKLIHQMTKLKH